MRALVSLLGLWLVVVGARAADAQPVAVDPDQAAPPARGPTEVARAPHGHAGVGGGLLVGQVRGNGLDDGWLGRLELEAVLLSPRGRVGGYFGYLTGPQLWKSGDDWGLGLPVAIETGLRAPGLRAGLLFGFTLGITVGRLWEKPLKEPFR